MRYGICEDHVTQVLAAWIGTKLAVQSPLKEQVTSFLMQKGEEKQPLEDTAKALETVLFQGLFRLLGPTMTTVMDDGGPRRIWLANLSEMTDDVLLVLMEDLPRNSRTDDLLQTYALDAGSRSALAVQYACLSSLHTQQDRTVMAEILRERYAKGWCPPWLNLPR